MIGITLGNRYEIVEKIGTGGMAIVYKAKCNLLDRFVAIKVLKEEFNNDEDFIRKFRRESQAAASLSHPNILNIYDVGSEEIDGRVIQYIVMEYIKGRTLKEYITEKGKLSVQETVDFSIQIAEALSHAHKNKIIHRDIKPHNIMVTDDKRIKVTDFGIARAVTSSTITTTSSVLGSVHYFSPEQARGGYTDEKSDIYSLGIVMYEMITGQVPFDGDSPIGVALKHVQEEIVPPINLNKDVPVELNQIIMKCVKKRQSERYQNTEEVLRDLRMIGKKYHDAFELTEDTTEMTRVLPGLNTIEGLDEEPMQRNSRQKNKNNRNKILVSLAAVIAAFVMITIIYTGYARLKTAIGASEDILMPLLIGRTEDEAQGIANQHSFQLNIIDRVSSSDYEAGVIIDQNVDEGVRIKKGYPVGVTISLGSNTVSVPMVVNRTLMEGEDLIKNANLRIDVSYEFSDEFPEDVIMRQGVEAYTPVAPNTRIEVVVSKGLETKEVIMIQLKGSTISNAMNEIVALGLAVGEVKYEPSDTIPANEVTWQSYEPGTPLETDTAVDLYVSSGPDPQPPDPVGNNEQPDNPPTAEETSFSFVLRPFEDRDETNVVIYRRQDGVTTMVYTGKHLQEDGAFQISVIGIPGAEFDVYFDDIYQFTRVKES
ncbi:MAG: Stk1 family PASTA domain-containing Ser/Thr kinase [Gudongella sp.]|nr:Stk1 family PASTA domain-containing Ser/Thr kinase [Gudongella sp.]